MDTEFEFSLGVFVMVMKIFSYGLSKIRKLGDDSSPDEPDASIFYHETGCTFQILDA